MTLPRKVLKIQMAVNLTMKCDFAWVFNNFMLIDELFAKFYRSLKTSVLVNNNLC